MTARGGRVNAPARLVQENRLTPHIECVRRIHTEYVIGIVVESRRPFMLLLLSFVIAFDWFASRVCDCVQWICVFSR